MADKQPRDVSDVAALFADRARARMIGALIDGRRLPASRLASEAGVSAATASGHLRRMLDGGIVRVEVSGRHRFYYLADRQVAAAYEAMSAMSPLPPITSLREGTRMARLRTARTCYDHFAGRLGVAITAALIDSGVLLPRDSHADTRRRHGDRLSAPVAAGHFTIGPRAADELRSWGVDLVSVEGLSRPTLRFCLDWTEQQEHLAGALGAAILTAAREREWVCDGPRPRELALTEAGTDGFARLAPTISEQLAG
ncbi:transcriptional regulator [Flexivirga endophytica]|uniref:Transcriptional regulator n=1 Tax=Flexivirga endophytica TaxID=1849103 RepID=A0A916TD98_9MICO|nr:helix-turn-helix transcriptional regulator [Flexivirga endophytica]GGB41051.1 transcriptional regulator [Flexivirga endophytica]GHB48850.1 transcriptional regulator [Flexivirga endophytica]